MAIYSPGPFAYSPKQTLTKTAANAHTLALKAPSYFDTFLDPERQPSPGPVYLTSGKDRQGRATWGNDPKATFGR